MLCNPNSKLLCGKCSICFDRSFASQPMATSWSKKNTFNARDMMKGSDKKAWFCCKTCHHEFESRIFSIKSSTYCPYCSNQQLCNNDDCKICLSKSCASHEMTEAWSTKNIIVSRNVFLQTNKKYIFNCLVCKHEYETTPNRYYNRKGSCSYCTNTQLCDNESCTICFNKSFASHERAKCWSDKNIHDPRMIFRGSESKYIFNCDKCKSEFNSKLYNVLTGYWCPFCKNKTEGKVLEYLREHYPDCKTQLRFEWCRFSKTNNIMPFDFGLTGHKLLIELDGRQHFQQIAKWDAPELTQEKDNEKICFAIKNGYSIIHIYQDEVWNDKYDWKTILKENIELLIATEKPQVLFISKADVYATHIEKLDAEIIYQKVQVEVKE
jgi:very-short-patch-repair endonuclease